MNTSIYHFFVRLVENRDSFIVESKLSWFPFPEEMLSCQSAGKWPDLALKINKGNRLFSGGELIELKDSRTLTVSSFNSTIPLGQKNINSVFTGKTSLIRDQMEAAGDDVFSLKIRDVYYLIRGRRNNSTRVCLTHGKFFETISETELVSGSFRNMLDAQIKETGVEIPDDIKERIEGMFTHHDTFSQSRHVEKASVKLRFRVMTEVEPEGNVLIYPEIRDQTLTLLVPYSNSECRTQIVNLMQMAFIDCQQSNLWEQIESLDIQHKLNGPFIGFQINL